MAVGDRVKNPNERSGAVYAIYEVTNETVDVQGYREAAMLVHLVDANGNLLNPAAPVLGAGTNRIGGAYQVSGQIIDENGTVLTVKRAFANVAASQTDASIIAAVALKKLRVLWVMVIAGGTATNLTFNSKPGGAGVAISPLLANSANGGEVLPPNIYGWFETLVGEALTVTTGAGSTSGVAVGYVEVA